ncbi:ABC-F family ATP-binding cassette domain-containing protein [Timonella sp. A28]|uniref:ABC-F family ATP-binding cassette domain-containing protein n=1 Tax=Timonella sp. A28 TaxID=3442640 RepID=UPI003EB9AE38
MHVIAENIEYHYPGRRVLSGVDVRVSQGDRLALVGENGSGKTTLLRVLAQELHPQVGTVRTQGTRAYVPQEFDTPPHTTVGDIIDTSLAALHDAAAQLETAAHNFDHNTGSLAELTRILEKVEHLAAWDAERRITEALTRLSACTRRETLLSELSVGERYRVRLACTLVERQDILLLDEPTNHLDEAAISYLTATMMNWHGAIIVVTHDRMLLDDVATAILDLDPSMDGKPSLYGQPGYLAFRFAKNEAWRRWNQRYRAERKRAIQLEQRLDRTYEGLSDEWRPPKGSQKNRRGTRARIHVKAADRLVEKLKAEAVEIPPPPPVLNFPDLPAMSPGWDPDSPLIDVRNIRADHNGHTMLDLPARRITITPASRLLVTGPNGSGKSTFLRVLDGSQPISRGYRTARDDLRCGIVSQESTLLNSINADAHPTCFDLYAQRALDLLSSGKLDPENVVPVAYLGLLSEEILDRPFAELSAGQRKRFELACALLAMPHVLILDEPTNHLSIDLVDDLTQALIKTSAAVVVATHDRQMRADFATWTHLDL